MLCCVLQSQSDGQLFTFDASAAQRVTSLIVTIYINPRVATTEAANDPTTSTDVTTDPTTSNVTTETMTSNDSLDLTTQASMTTNNPLDASSQQDVTFEILIRACPVTGIACALIAKSLHRVYNDVSLCLLRFNRVYGSAATRA